MTPKGTAFRKVRVPDDVWKAALAAFPAERGKPSGMSAEMLGFITFLAEHPGDWRTIKALAAEQGIEPWRLIAETLAS